MATTENILQCAYRVQITVPGNDDINAIIEYLKNEIALKGISSPSKKKAYNAITKYLKNSVGGHRDYIKYTKRTMHNGKECQVFTDSYTFYRLDDPIDGLPDFDTEYKGSNKYFDFSKFMIDDFENLQKITVTKKDISLYIKTYDKSKLEDKKVIFYAIDGFDDSNGKFTINANYLNTAFDILQSNTLDIYNIHKWWTIAKSDKGYVVICRIRRYE